MRELKVHSVEECAECGLNEAGVARDVPLGSVIQVVVPGEAFEITLTRPRVLGERVIH